MKSLWIIAHGGANEPKVLGIPIDQKQTETSQSAVAVKDVNAPGPPQTGAKRFDPTMIAILGFMLIFMYFILFRGPKKREQEHRKMIQSLKKNDKVRTIGGIIGIIVDVKDDEITLKVDESTNTKIKVLPSAIGKNLADEKGK